MSTSRLFKPLKLGNIELKHRIAMAPLTRMRADENHVPLPMAIEYYSQRASVPGTLLVTEATFISKEHGGYPNVPGIYSAEQIEGWKKITTAVHEKGSFIYLQLWALGRTANPDFAKANNITIKSSSATQLSDKHAVPQEMTSDDIKTTIATYAQAAKNAIEAGFDGVEIHGANGYLIDQFNQDPANKRTDKYGGSVENRSRFGVEVTKAVVEAVGAERVGLRLSPFGTFQGMGMKEPYPQFTDIIKKINPLGLAYLHLVESRVDGVTDVLAGAPLDPLIEHFDGPVLVAGGMKADNVATMVDEERKDKDIVVVFGRYFISNPDLPFRLKEGIELTPYDRADFYRVGKEEGYITQPFSKEWLALQGKVQA